MSLHLPRTLHMRLVLAVAAIQLLAVSVFAAYWVIKEISVAVDGRQVLAHRVLNIAAPSVERMLGAGDRQEMRRYLDRVTADPMINGVTVKDAQGGVFYQREGRNAALHPVAAWFEPKPLRSGLKVQLWRDGMPLGVLSLSLANDPINAQVNDAIEQVLVFFFIVLALDLIATQLIIRFFVAPLGPLTEMAMNVSQGFLDSTVMPEPSASDEVKKVGLALVTSARMMQKQIRDLEQTRAQLAQNELRLRNLVNSMREVLVELDRHGNILFLNPAWEKLTGHRVNDCLGRPFSRFLAQPQQQALFVFGRLETLAPTDVQVEIRAGDGHSVWMQMNTTLQFGEHGEFTGIVGTLEDVSEQLRLQQLQREHEQELVQLSITDPLTGVYNRRHFDEMMVNLLDMNLGRKRPVALIIIDIDGFKFINDTYGHAAGDETLRTIAALIGQRMQPSDYLARLAADEFALILRNTNLQQATDIARALHDTIHSTSIALTVGRVQLQCCIGVAAAPMHGATTQELLSAADVALYHAKRRGPNRVEALSPDISRALRSIFSQGFKLRDALEQGNLMPAFQPICDIDSGRPVAYEALARMQHNGSLIKAGDFIAVAEELGLTRDIDLHIIEQSLRLAPVGYGLFLNLDPSSFSDRGFTRELGALLGPACRAGRAITIEITEREHVVLGEALVEDIQHLRGLGCKLALDDFGSGYSTYHFLNLFRPEYLKIEGTFVRRMLDHESDRMIVEHIHELAQAFGAQTIAESVENEATRQALRRIGIRSAQGLHLGSPLLSGEHQ